MEIVIRHTKRFCLAIAYVSLAVLSVFLFQPAAIAQQATDAPSVDAREAFDLEKQLESFDIVWNTVRQAHWDRQQVGENWDAAREKYRPQIDAATSIADVRKVLNAMLDSLGQSHYGIIPFETYGIMEERKHSGGEGFSGLRLRYINDQLVVTHVVPDSPADAAGVDAGWILEQIADQRAGDYIEKTRKILKHSPGRIETYVALGAEAKTTGAIGETLTCRFSDHDDALQTKKLELVKGPGRLARFGHLPPSNVVFQSQQLSDDVGYLAFNSFLDGPHLIQQYTEALDSFRETNGLIIDLRGNRGGMVILVMGMSRWFVGERQSLGEMIMSTGPLKLVLNPGDPRFEKPVAVLIDDCSISAAEIMSGGLKDIGAARVFGQRSAGLVLPSAVRKLPNGDGFQFALANYVSASGEVLEGDGVEPHEVIELCREDLKGNRDPVLDRAKQWILEQKKQADKSGNTH